MSKIVITVSKQEIEYAILDFVNQRITVGGRKRLQDPSLFFSNKDGAIGFFTCLVEADDAVSGLVSNGLADSGGVGPSAKGDPNG